MSLSKRMRLRYEAHMKEIRDRNAREDYVRAAGISEGSTATLERMNHLTQLLAEQNRTDDIIKAASDKEYQQKLLEEFHL